jgi:hypothetical protein
VGGPASGGQQWRAHSCVDDDEDDHVKKLQKKIYVVLVLVVVVVVSGGPLVGSITIHQPTDPSKEGGHNKKNMYVSKNSRHNNNIMICYILYAVNVS